MKKITTIAAMVTLIALSLASSDSFARGGFSSSGGRGGYSGGRSYSSQSRSYSAPRTTTTTRTTTINRSYYGGGGYYGYHPMMYPGFGMGFGYSNGIMTGLIIGSLMHPQGTTVYQGGGYGGSALLYPDGRVVDQNGYQVGTYINGQFTAVQGGMVAQQAPAGAMQQMQQQPTPVVIDASPSAWEIVGYVILAVIVILVIIAVIA